MLNLTFITIDKNMIMVTFSKDSYYSELLENRDHEF